MSNCNDDTKQILAKLDEIQAKTDLLSQIAFDVHWFDAVSDSDGGKHSVFANKFIDVLKNNNNVIQSMYLFQNVSDYVINNAQQTPNRTIIHGTGDDGGDFFKDLGSIVGKASDAGFGKLLGLGGK